MKTMITLLISCIALPMLSFAQNHPPVAVNDTLVLQHLSTDTITVHALWNDYDPDGDSIYISTVTDDQHYVSHTDSSITFYFDQSIYMFFNGSYSNYYRIKDEHGNMGAESFAYVVILFNSKVYDSICTNNINAHINAFGNHFWNFDFTGDYTGFEVPAHSGKGTIFNSSLWIGGLDENEMLHFAGERYRQGPDFSKGADYWPGPVATHYDSAYKADWYKLWKVSQEQINYHALHYQDEEYSPIETIATWPGNGDPDYGMPEQLAPFYDHNENGVYEPMEGDHPLIRGDEAVFFIFNDDAYPHTESEGVALGVEVHGMAYGFNQSGDSALNNTLFFHYDMINRSTSSYTDTYATVFTDFDLGSAYDDYIGCDVERGSVICYNGDSIDGYGEGEPEAYGEHPPAQSLTLLGGPYLDDDNEDNPEWTGDCGIFDWSTGIDDPNYGHAINGVNFGDGTVDNERLGMSSFMYFQSSGVPNHMTDPDYAPEYYLYMKNIWKDNTPAIYGGNGHIETGGYGPECRFIFPATSDPCNWGTGGETPNGPVNWTEETAGNAPHDRRGIATSGPFTFAAGSTHQLDFAFTFARDYTGETGSVELLKSRIDSLLAKVDNEDLLALQARPVGIEEPGTGQEPGKLKIYPNPAKDEVMVEYPVKSKVHYTISNLTGKTILYGILKRGEKHPINIQHLKPGIYIISLNNIQSSKLVIIE
ncbi:MAG: T9SS type A sorting domain-containing protein [Bacteroidales bacterium]|nr:T9SS type A sorting domain-containing protein [Bacteroidales bacterium]